jgi:hypothetical protein
LLENGRLHPTFTSLIQSTWSLKNKMGNKTTWLHRGLKPSTKKQHPVNGAAAIQSRVYPA